jgi:hypothetical protein
VTDLAATPVICFQPEPWQIEQTVDEEVTEGILKSSRLVVRLYYAGEFAASEHLLPLYSEKVGPIRPQLCPRFKEYDKRRILVLKSAL